MTDITPGDKVAYIPYHAKGDIKHRDVEYGVVSSVIGDTIFVRFGNMCNSQGCRQDQLRKVL